MIAKPDTRVAAMSVREARPHTAVGMAARRASVCAKRRPRLFQLSWRIRTVSDPVTSLGQLWHDPPASWRGFRAHGNARHHGARRPLMPNVKRSQLSRVRCQGSGRLPSQWALTCGAVRPSDGGADTASDIQPVNTRANSIKRSVTLPEFIKFAARRKNGTASRMKEL